MIPANYTEEFEVANANFGRPHVFLLGAGASYAAFPNGDKNGRKLPLLKDFIEVIGLQDFVNQAGITEPYEDFEEIYSKIALDVQLEDLRRKIDRKVFSYFENLELPDEPTLYDHLVLSLRPKDIIATFNWDPFLWDACQRNRQFSKYPCVLFLHGSVAIARCEQCQIIVSRSNRQCSSCGSELYDIPILFPVTKKDYNSDPAIAGHWRTLKRALKQAYAFTIFGYSAPKTDVEAIDLLKDGWGENNSRELEQIEIINTQDEDMLRESWDEFIHTHHYDVLKNFYQSFAGEHPRRSCEAMWSQFMECMFIEPFTIPQGCNFRDLYKWLKPRIEVEKR